jgi:ParB/RepB/Spo0J family partition protein
LNTQLIPIGKIKPSGTNPRTLFEDAKLKELAQDIKLHGIIQPLVVRDIDGRYELVAGERRLRAAKLANLSEVPAVVRVLSELEADEIQLVENAQRVDLHYVEEATAFDRLRAEHGLSTDQIAAKTGKKPGYVTHILKLAGLSPAVKQAALERNSPLTIGYGSLIAKINDHKAQDRFLTAILKGDHSNKPLRVKDAEKLLERDYQIHLSKATFNTNDAELYPGTGACGACPFNTTNLDRTIYKDKEICTKPTCFKEKEKLRFDQLAAAAKNEGLVVIPSKKSKDVFDQFWGKQGEDRVTRNSDFIGIDESRYISDYGHTTLRTVLKGDAMPQLHIARGPSGKTVYLVNRKDADAALEKIRRLKSNQQSLRSPGKTTAQKKSEQNLKAGKQASRAAVLKIVDSVEKVEIDEKLRKPFLVLLSALRGYEHEERLAAALKRREILEAVGKGFDKRRAALNTFWTKHASKLSVKEILGLCVEGLLGPDHYQNYNGSFSESLKLAAGIYKINLAALKTSALKEIQTAEREKAAKKKATKKRGK